MSISGRNLITSAGALALPVLSVRPALAAPMSLPGRQWPEAAVLRQAQGRPQDALVFGLSAEGRNTAMRSMEISR